MIEPLKTHLQKPPYDCPWNLPFHRRTCLGDRAIIGACAIVTRDLTENNIVAGNPTSPIRALFDSQRDLGSF